MASLQFWKPGTVGPGSNLDRASQTEEFIVPSAPSSSSLSLQSARERLPIFKHSAPSSLPIGTIKFTCHNILIGQRLLYAVQNHGVVILVGHTGSGKTTRVYP